MLIALVFLDLFWSVAALTVDVPKLLQLHIWLWPIVLICPVYPLLLAILWYCYIKKKTPNQYVAAFAIIGSAIFGVLALLFYPAVMYYQGFNLRDFGQIFWVLFYGAQGWYLIRKTALLPSAVLVASAYLIIKFSLDIKYATFGYLAAQDVAPKALLVIYVIAIGLIVFLAYQKLVRKHLNRTKNI